MLEMEEDFLWASCSLYDGTGVPERTRAVRMQREFVGADLMHSEGSENAFLIKRLVHSAVG